jgi:hypothetical protein
MSIASDMAVLMALIEQANNVVNSANTYVDQAATQGSSQSSTTVSTLTTLNTTASAISIPSGNGINSSVVTAAAINPTNQEDLTNATSSITTIQAASPSANSVANTAANTVGTVSKTGP